MTAHSSLSPHTLHLLDELYKIERRHTQGYAPVSALSNLLKEKHFYVGAHKTMGGRQTNRDFIRLMSEPHGSFDDKTLEQKALKIDDVRDVMIALDGFYGLGLGTLSRLLEYPCLDACASAIRHNPHGKKKALIPPREEPQIQHYVFDPERGEALVAEMTRDCLGHPFGTFLFRADQISDDGANFLVYYIGDLARVLKRPSSVSYRIAQRAPTPITQYEPALAVSSSPGDLAWLV